MAKTRQHLRHRVGKAYDGVARRLVRKALAACQRFSTQDDEALHDFRVAVRRLRTHLATLRGHLGRQPVKKIRKQLSELVSATNTSRDYEIQRRWIDKQLRSGRVSPLQREGLQFILDEIQPPGERLTDLEPIKESFTQLSKELRKRRWSVSGGGKRRRDDSVAAAAAALRKHSAKLRNHLEKIESIDSIDATHRARLAAKRLRYILEPIAEEVPGGRKVLSELKAMQDRLGELRDRQLLERQILHAAETLPAFALHPAAAAGGSDAPTATVTHRALQTHQQQAMAAGLDHVRREAHYHFTVVQERWLGDHADRLRGRIEDIAAAL